MVRRPTTINGRVKRYMFYIRDHAANGLIKSDYNGKWGVTYVQGSARPNTFVRRCKKNWMLHWQSLPALRKLHKLSHALKDSEGRVPSKAEFQARPQVGAVNDVCLYGEETAMWLVQQIDKESNRRHCIVIHGGMVNNTVVAALGHLAVTL